MSADPLGGWLMLHWSTEMAGRYSRVLAGPILALVLVAPSISSATTLTFEEIGLGPPEIPDGYGGLDWDNWNRHFGSEGSGYSNGRVSGTNTAYNGGGTEAVIFGPRFNFSSVYLTAAWRDGLAIRIVGQRSGTLVFDQTIVVDTTGPTLASFGHVVDELMFTASGGTNPGLIGDGTHIAMDDFTFFFVPEPAPSTLLLIAALAARLMSARSRLTRHRS
jgi:hypothetical protein